MPTIPPAIAVRPLVLSLDIGSSSIRAMIFDSQARDVAGLVARATYVLRATDDGGQEADATAMLTAVACALDEVLAAVGPLAGEIAAVASCSLVSNLLGVDAAGRPTTPVYFWGDTRPGPRHRRPACGGGRRGMARAHRHRVAHQLPCAAFSLAGAHRTR